MTDRRISGIHVTFMACLFNLSQYFHKFYVFRLVDAFGIFMPQAFLTVVSLAAWALMGHKFIALERSTKESWHVSAKTLGKQD